MRHTLPLLLLGLFAAPTHATTTEETIAEATAAYREARPLESRALLRTLDPGDPRVKAPLDAVEAACLAKAAETMRRATRLEARGAFEEALRESELALRFADRPHSSENQAARALDARLRQRLAARPAPAATPTELVRLARRDLVLEHGRAAHDASDCLRARRLFREALALDPASREAREAVAASEQVCRANAERQLREAQAYEAAVNYPEAVKACDLGLKYADDPDSDVHRALLDARRRIRGGSEER